MGSILIEPVVMPCSHELCLACFKPHLDQTSLCCPICRRRVSNWVRSKDGKLVDVDRWNTILQQFPERFVKDENKEFKRKESLKKRKLKRKISKAGELHSEYLEEVKRQKDEQDEERRRDEELAKRLQEEEAGTSYEG